MNSWPAFEDHCCNPWKQRVDAWQYPVPLGCTSLQASSQTACHLAVHVPWLCTANAGHLERAGSPSCAWAEAVTLLGTLPDHELGPSQLQEGRGYSSRGCCEIWLWYFDIQSPRSSSEEAQSRVSVAPRRAGDGLSGLREGRNRTGHRGSCRVVGKMKSELNVVCI